MKSRRQVTTEELKLQLREQVGFIRASCNLFDEGHLSEGKRIATAARILVHDTSRSHSLLKQLGHKETLEFVSLAVPNKSYNEGPYHGLLNIGLPKTRYIPKLNAVQARPMQFDSWWSEAVLKDGDGTLYSRRELVLFVADTDGGAHVDPEMDAAYQKLTRENHVGYQVARGGTVVEWRDNPVLPSLRQIGHEILETLRVLEDE